MNAHHAHRYNIWLIACVVLLCALGLSSDALAQAMGGAGSFSCSGGTASGKLYDSGSSCPTTMGFDNIFSFVVCNMEQLSSNLLGNMFCGMIDYTEPAIIAVLTFAVVIFGIAFTIGVVPATAREFMSFLMKVSFILVFATQADYLIGYGYKFLITGIRDGVSTVLASYFPTTEDGTTASSGADMYKLLDRFLGQTIQYATDAMSSTNLADSCRNAIFSVIAVMAIAFPWMSYLAVLIIAKIALTFLRAVFSYVYAITGIAFLLVLAPFFLSFFMFRQTRALFDKWVGYMVSFALQVVLLFAFLTFILSLNVSSITSSFTDIIMPVQETHEGTSIRMPWQYCTICEFKAVDRESGAEIPDTDYSNFIGRGKLVCKDNPGRPISALAAAAPEGGGAPSNAVTSSLIRFTFAGLLSLFVLAYVVDTILRHLPKIAQFLASGFGGATYAPQIGGGEGARSKAVGIPLLEGDGGGIIQDLGDGFQRGFSAHSNSVSGVAEGLNQARRELISGNERAPQGQRGGIGNRITRWFNDPN